ncbi:hypothetical protein MXMO3_01715 [Maritalea myrionectae]|uniref:Uncharacterized protein n=1 Tax=Maritalea myrionectae TaxID=454601 RepID=A0A2R4MDX9_9HYPH|nr:hypothetical protein [Maritalea myrionectae]AVX04241.1 hypothetical protein MXMO3_01715 [Maritalea myrionectae]
MPFNKTQPLYSAPGTPGLSQYDEPEPAFLETLGAAYRQENLIGSALTYAPTYFARQSEEFQRLDPDYDVFDDLQGYEQYNRRFVGVYNQKSAEIIKQQIDQEIEDRKILDASGWVGIGLSGVAAITDPTILLPGGALVKSGRAGFSATKSGVNVGLASGYATGIQEAGLQATQEVRTGEETVLNISGSALLGGILGATASKFINARDFKGLGDRTQAEFADDGMNVYEVSDALVQKAQGVGAAAYQDPLKAITLDDLDVGGNAAKKVADATAALRINPGVQTMLSPSTAVRRIYNQLVDNPIYTRMNMEGETLGSSVENLVKQYSRGALGEWIGAVAGRNGLYRKARQAGFGGTRTDFNKAVAVAARRNDIDPNGNEYVTQAAKLARDKIFSPLLKRAQEVGVLPDDIEVRTAPSYVSRLWNQQKLIAFEPQFKARVKKWADQVIAKQEVRRDEVDLSKRILGAGDLQKNIERLDARLERVVSQIDKRVSRRGNVTGKQKKTLGRLKGTSEQMPKMSAEEVVGTGDANKRFLDLFKEAQAAVKPQSFRDRFPTLQVVKDLGGVKTGSTLASELKAMGVTPKTRPGLFRKSGGLSDVDNLVKSENEIFTNLPGDGSGFVDRQAVLNAISDEIGGSPLRTDEMLEADSIAESISTVVQDWLEVNGLPSDATLADVKRMLDAPLEFEGAILDLAKLDEALETFDLKTDDLRLTQSALDAERKALQGKIDTLNDEIIRLQGQRGTSPNTRRLIEFSLKKRDLAVLKSKKRGLEKEVSTLRRASGVGVEDKLSAKLSDLTRINERIRATQANADKLEARLPKTPEGMPNFVNEADREDYVKEVVNSIYANLTSRGKGDVPAYIVPVETGFLKGRTFSIPDADIEEFLENDIELILRRYARDMGADVELAGKFGRADMKDQIKEIEADYQVLRDKAKTPKERDALTKAEKADIERLSAFRDMMRGTYRQAEQSSAWGGLTRAALTWNYIRLLGGVTLSSMSDAARLIGVHGVRATMTEALPSLISNVRAVKISKTDARELGAVTEMVLQGRLASLADLQDPYRYGSNFDRFLSNSSNMFSKATGLGWWNDTVKTMASVMTQNRILKHSLNYDKAPAAEKKYLAFLGIGKKEARQIAEQFKRHGSVDRGIHAADVSKWDEATRRIYGAALNKDVDRTIVTKGVSDQPLWTRSNWGKLIMQFKSFGLASHQRVLIAGLQERPHRMAEQLVFASAIGMMISWLKFIERGDQGRADQLVENPGLWVANGLDRTGILSIPFEISNTAEKLGLPVGITKAIQAAAGDEDQSGGVSRYASRNQLGAVLGPSAGLFKDLSTIAAQLSNQEITRSGVNAMIRQVPGASLPGVRSVMHQSIKPLAQEAVE